MPLTFDVSEIKDYDKNFPARVVTQETATPFEGPGRYFHPVTERIVMENIGIGIPRITEENVGEWYDRYVLLCADWDTPTVVTREQVEKHIGLRTNVSPLNKRQFAARRKRVKPKQAATS